ncbi:hypothetical protein AGMMS49992_28430 [Clostridia bacterium]|nr:hypothetical protein AGMMS49992_28430 [Clostridia bacterium]
MHIGEVENNLKYVVGITTIYAYMLADNMASMLIHASTSMGTDYLAETLQVASCTVDELRSLSDKYSVKFPEVTTAYAGALVSLAYYSAEDESAKCMERLQCLYLENNQSSSNIAIQYAMSLNNYIMILGRTPTETGLKKANEARHRLENLYKTHVANAVNLQDLVMGVVNGLSDPKLRTVLDDEMKLFSNQVYMYQGEVAVEYAKGLNNLISINVQMNRHDDAYDIFVELGQLCAEHCAEMSLVKIEYAKGIVNLIYGCSSDTAQMLLDGLKQIYQTARHDRDIFIVRYAKALTNRLSRILKDGLYCDDADDTLNEMTALYFENRENKNCSFDLTKCFSQCLYNMFQLLVLTKSKQLDEDDSELETIYNMLHIVHKQSDPSLHGTIGQYITMIDRLFE